MFGMTTFDAIKDGSVKDTLNFDELLDEGAEDNLSALEGALCGDECEGDECLDVEFEDEDDPEDADDYFPGEPIMDIDDDDDPEEEEDDDYDDIVDGTDTDGFIEGFDDDDDPAEEEDDELGNIASEGALGDSLTFGLASKISKLFEKKASPNGYKITDSDVKTFIAACNAAKYALEKEIPVCVDKYGIDEDDIKITLNNASNIEDDSAYAIKVPIYKINSHANGYLRSTGRLTDAVIRAVHGIDKNIEVKLDDDTSKNKNERDYAHVVMIMYPTGGPASESIFDDLFSEDDIATEGFKSGLTSTITTVGELSTVLSSIDSIVAGAANLGINVVDMAIASVFEKVAYTNGIKQLREKANKTDDEKKKKKLLDRATRAEHIRDVMNGIQRKTPLDESLNKPNIMDRVFGWFQEVSGGMMDIYKGHLAKSAKKNEAKGNDAIATRQKAKLAYRNAMTVESVFDDLFTDDDIAIEGSAFEPKMDRNSFDSTYFDDDLDLEDDTESNLVLFDDEEDDEDEDDMGIELGLEGVGAGIVAGSIGFAVGTGMATGTVLGIEKLASMINDKKIEDKTGKEMRTPTEDELRDFYSAALKASTVVAKSVDSIAEKYVIKRNAIKYYEPKEKAIIDKMRKCKGAIGCVVAGIIIPTGTMYSKTTSRNYTAAINALKDKIANALPADIETYVDGGCITIYKVLK